MKQTIAAIFAFTLTVSSAVFASEATYHLRVDGISCPFCAYGIEKGFSKLKGVKTVDTDLQKGVVIVTMEEGEKLDQAKAREVVSETGFTLRGFKKVLQE